MEHLIASSADGTPCGDFAEVDEVDGDGEMRGRTDIQAKGVSEDQFEKDVAYMVVWIRRTRDVIFQKEQIWYCRAFEESDTQREVGEDGRVDA